MEWSSTLSDDSPNGEDDYDCLTGRRGWRLGGNQELYINISAKVPARVRERKRARRGKTVGEVAPGWRATLLLFLLYYSIAISYSACTFIVVIPGFLWAHTCDTDWPQGVAAAGQHGRTA